MLDPELNDRVALVTGGNNPHGIGAAIARALARQGAGIFLHGFRQARATGNAGKREAAEGPGLDFFDRQQARSASEVAASIREAGGAAESWDADLTDPDNIHELFARAEAAFGRVDILVNNAADYGADTFLPTAVTGDEVWEAGPALSTLDATSHDRHFAVNSRAPAILMTLFARGVIESGRGWGRVVNISADCAWGVPREVSYRASKYALESFSRAAAAELGPHGITVNIVSPGPVQSGYIAPDVEKALVPEIPLRRIGRPDDIADAVVFFASEQARWITGQLLFAHGGHRMG